MAATTAASQEFTAFYLQRTTQEFAEDLDKVREADDFKADSVPFLVHALQQGTALYSALDQERVVKPAAATAAATENEDVDMTEAAAEEVEEKEDKSRRKEKKDKSKKKRKSSG
ncbi:ribosome-assembly protein 3-domain-containing protein [Colletotrichum navitas]|uniref:Ribosome assembly protein 3 n=1 Tax=Colletotrichum navitas TaxID=681940 RepID=A0AAD8PU47_9PEZI|nr:ribosome-assembly protein 3-domain-containing protein [Colletotrichum navitas]KAK1584762.1 ribosome-assembly protein 3-domain-containing protein [Colletotrichum navitas]